MGESTLEILTRRLERLEQQNRFIRRAGAVLGVAVVAFFLMGQASPGGQVVEAQRFVVRDPSTGKGRAALSLLQDGSVGLSIVALDGRSLSLAQMLAATWGSPFMTGAENSALSSFRGLMVARRSRYVTAEARSSGELHKPWTTASVSGEEERVLIA